MMLRIKSSSYKFVFLQVKTLNSTALSIDPLSINVLGCNVTPTFHLIHQFTKSVS